MDQTGSEKKQEWFDSVYKFVSTVNIKVHQANSFLLAWVFFSFGFTMFSTAVSFQTSGPNFSFDEVQDPIILFSSFVQLSITTMNFRALKTLSNLLNKPFKEFPEESKQQETIKNFKRRVTTIGCFIVGFISLALLNECLRPILTELFLHSEDSHRYTLLPVGKVFKPTKSVWFYLFCYAASVTSFTTCCVMYVCWFSAFVCSTLHISTNIKLLVMEMALFNERVASRCDAQWMSLTPFNGFTASRNALVTKVATETLRDLVNWHVEIIRHVKHLELAYRWVIFLYCKTGIALTAVGCTMMIYEWAEKKTLTFEIVNTVVSTLFVLYINCYCGQIILNGSEQLRRAACDLTWAVQNKQCRLSLLVMTTQAHRPLRLTAGATFTMGMHAYTMVMEAVYSYINFLISISIRK